MAEVENGLILIVEDTADIALLEKRSLEKAGYLSVTVATPEEAMNYVRKGGIDLIILDYLLADGNTGLQFYEELKREGYRLPVIMVTGLNDEATILEALRAGVRDFVNKSTEYLKYLPEAVRRALSQERAERALAQSQGALKRTASLLLSALEATADGLLVVDRELKITHFNKRFTEIWHLSKEILETYDGQEAIAFVLDQLINPEDFIKTIEEMSSNSLAESHDILRFRDGRVIERFSQPQMLDGESVGRVWTFHDITERKESEERLRHMAHYDALTQLPNRSLLHDRIVQMLAQAGRTGKLVALFFLDLDRFKAINDSLGHVVGDELLKAVAERLKECVRQSDTVARWGGDEFTIILTNINHPLGAVKIAQKILDALSKPFILGPELFITASIGITLYPTDGLDVDNLLRNADAAMYQAKAQGKNNYKFYTPEMNKTAIQSLSMENNLRRALERNELSLHYQPQVDLHTGCIVGVEALARWLTPDQGWISPAKFIPIAEETGLIGPIGEWVLKVACAQNRAWQEAGIAPIRVVVNLSGRQFKDRQLIKTIREILRETGLSPTYLGVELTESVIMNDAEFTINTLRKLTQMGIQISVDDFGTGYSSLSYLKRFPLHILKIDPSFVREITTHAADAAIATSIIGLAHSLKLKVMAEGVETKNELLFLRQLGCDEMQGYYFSKPLSLEPITMLLKEGRRLIWDIPGDD
jgi:diguanylate cyclase (GGDEF)-like protein/PAS domain S-box-containing protein